jgi:hypothetical protein
MRRDKGTDGFEQNEQSVAQQCKRPEPPEIRRIGHHETEKHQHRNRGQKQEQEKRKNTDDNQQFHDELIPWVSVKRTDQSAAWPGCQSEKSTAIPKDRNAQSPALAEQPA